MSVGRVRDEAVGGESVGGSQRHGNIEGGLSWSRVKLNETDEWWKKRGVVAGGGIYTDLLCGWERDVKQTGNHHGWRPGALSKGAKVSPAKGDGEPPPVLSLSPVAPPIP